MNLLLIYNVWLFYAEVQHVKLDFRPNWDKFIIIILSITHTSTIVIYLSMLDIYLYSQLSVVISNTLFTEWTLLFTTNSTVTNYSSQSLCL